MPSWDNAVGHETDYLTEGPLPRSSYAVRYRRLIARLDSRANRAGLRLVCEEGEAALLEWDNTLEKYKVHSCPQTIPALRRFLSLLEEVKA
jgi:hypothetical protein